MASEAAVPAGARPEKTRLVYPKLGIPFVLLLLCFAAWGAAANLTDVLVGVFRAPQTIMSPAELRESREARSTSPRPSGPPTAWKRRARARTT